MWLKNQGREEGVYFNILKNRKRMNACFMQRDKKEVYFLCFLKKKLRTKVL